MSAYPRGEYVLNLREVESVLTKDNRKDGDHEGLIPPVIRGIFDNHNTLGCPGQAARSTPSPVGQTPAGILAGARQRYLPQAFRRVSGRNQRFYA